MQELKKVFNDKFPDKMETYEIFKERLEKTVDIVPTPPDTEAIKREIKIRDEKDRPILRSAIAAKAGTIITGDKDLLDSGIKRPKMINSAEFINENIKKK
jgi:putative PIN family toxin of toxin-antitoxin system